NNGTQGVWESTNSGASWTHAKTTATGVVPTSIATGTAGNLPNAVYAGQSDGTLLISEDAGATWSSVAETGMGTAAIQALQADPGSKTVYAGIGTGFFVATDPGTNPA